MNGFTKFELLTSPSFSKIHILSILLLATQRGPRKFLASSAAPFLAFPISIVNVAVRYDFTHALFKVLLKTVKTASKKCKKCFLVFLKKIFTSHTFLCYDKFAALALEWLIIYHKCTSDTCVTNKYIVSPYCISAAPAQCWRVPAQPGGSYRQVLNRGHRSLSSG